jgi:hypothetical protein
MRPGHDRPQHDPIKNGVPHWFRFGASSLAHDILMPLQKEADGQFHNADYFSLD